MICDVKCNIVDYPKRTQSLKDIITVEAYTDDEAMALAVEQGRDKWPGGKVKPFDVVNKRNTVKRPTLKAKTA